MLAIPKVRRPWVAVYRSSGIGDCLVASSPVSLLAKDFNVEVLCDAPYGEIWEHNPHVAKVSELPADTLPKGQGEWQHWFRMRAREYVALYNLSQTMEATLALVEDQPAFDWPASVRRERCGRSYLEFAHEVCQVPHVFDPGPRFYPSPQEKADAKRVKATVGERVIGIPVSGSRIDKTWPWLPMLCAKVLRDLEIPIILFGGNNPRDVAIADKTHEVVQKLNNNTDGLHCCISKDTKELTVEWSIRRNLAQIQTCDLVITPDTGMAWAVAMEAMPKIALVSHASVENITKHWRNTVTLHADPQRVPCWPCHRLHNALWSCTKAEKVDAAACMDDIHDDIVLEHVRTLLAPPPAAMPIDTGNMLNVPLMAAEPLPGYIGLRRIDAAAE